MITKALKTGNISRINMWFRTSLALPVQEAHVQSLVGELRPHKLHGMAKR